jgi:hypothetical protein
MHDSRKRLLVASSRRKMLWRLLLARSSTGRIKGMGEGGLDS